MEWRNLTEPGEAAGGSSVNWVRSFVYYLALILFYKELVKHTNKNCL